MGHQVPSLCIRSLLCPELNCDLGVASPLLLSAQCVLRHNSLFFFSELWLPEHALLQPPTGTNVAVPPIPGPRTREDERSPYVRTQQTASAFEILMAPSDFHTTTSLQDRNEKKDTWNCHWTHQRL